MTWESTPQAWGLKWLAYDLGLREEIHPTRVGFENQGIYIYGGIIASVNICIYTKGLPVSKNINKANKPALKKTESTALKPEKLVIPQVSTLTPAQLAQAKKDQRATEHHLSKNPKDYTWN